jgi:hypothetical protein
MMNEMLQREARYIDPNGHNVLYSICGSKIGRHSSVRRNRLSELDDLGPGVVLYFKMLKYFQCCFFMFTLISLPTVLLCISGSAYVNYDVKTAKYLAASSLGSLNENQNIDCSYLELDQSRIKSMKLECSHSGDNGNGFALTELLEFGIA